ncbi:flagellar basal body rod protein FlgC [Oxalobacteraceae bacterium CAVE-383]|nr:flagellar basal body rod protein FlgC [Oxalobacteraceae bacterium CAVE-383]
MASLSDIFTVSGSAMSAQAKRLNATASNIANADSATGPDGQPYRAKQVVFKAVPVGGVANSGVQVDRIVENQAPPKLVYDPKSPLADGNGFVAMPNVNPVEEMVNMISASRSYQDNVEVMNSAKTLLQKTLTIGQ